MGNRSLFRTLATAVLGAVLIGPALAVAPAGAALPAVAAPALCTASSASSTVCIDSLTVSPVSVPNDQDVTATVTVHVSSGSPSCLSLLPPDGLNGAGVGPAVSLKRSGTSAFWTGTLTTKAFVNRPGTYQWYELNVCSPFNFVHLADQPAGGPVQPVVVTGSDDTAGPVLRSLTLTPASADVTTKDGAFAVTARLTDDYSGTAVVHVQALPASVPAAGPGALGQLATVSLSRTAGTPRDGTWTGTLSVAGGTGTSWSLAVLPSDAMVNAAPVSTGELAARGMASTFTTRTTAPPPTPSGVRAVSGTTLGGGHRVTFTGTAQPAGKPMSTAWRVTSGPNCGLQDWFGPGASTVADLKPGWQLCTFSVVAVNAAGSSKAVTVTALI